MSWIGRLLGVRRESAPRASVQSADGGQIIVTPEQMEAAMRNAVSSLSGERVTADTAMRIAAVYACVRIISGPIATLPLQVMRRVDDKTREKASDTSLWTVLQRRPNRWQTPSQFKRMMQAHQLLRGNGYASIVRDAFGNVVELIPLHPDRVKPKQRPDLSLEFIYSSPNGGTVIFGPDDVLHLVLLTLDGINGVTPITYARETLGAALSMERHGANTFRNGAQVGLVLKTSKSLGDEGKANIKAGLDAYRAQGEGAGKALILEDGLDVADLGMTSVDAQWIEGRKFARGDIAMFFGVPPHMIGDTEKTTSWGTGIEQQGIGFVTYTLEDYFTMWEERLDASCISDANPDLYTRFNRTALVRGDLAARQSFYSAMLDRQVFVPDQVLALEDMNPRADGKGGEVLPRSNATGVTASPSATTKGATQ